MSENVQLLGHLIMILCSLSQSQTFYPFFIRFYTNKCKTKIMSSKISNLHTIELTTMSPRKESRSYSDERPIPI